MLNKNDIKDEHIDKAFELIESYCKENQLDVLTFVQDKNNIEPASKEIHKKLPWALRFVLSQSTIQTMITDNHDWIVEKAKEKTKKIKPT